MRQILICIIVTLTMQCVLGYHSILDHGAIPSSNITADAFKNADAFLEAIKAANASETDREVLIPRGYKFVMMPTHVDYLSFITINVEGTVILSEDNVNWPNKTENDCWDFWTFTDSHDLHFKGNGKVDGNGYAWWWREIFVRQIAGRPHLLMMERNRNIEIEGTRWVNSPYYHLYLTDIDSFYIHDMEIFVDIFKQ